MRSTTVLRAAVGLGWTPKSATGAAHLYDCWAASYDRSVQHWGYCAPLRVAKLLKDASDADASSPSGLDSSLPVCDAGCGSGLSGLALREEGISAPLVGFDVSSEMLRLCKEKGVYQSVTGW